MPEDPEKAESQPNGNGSNAAAWPALRTSQEIEPPLEHNDSDDDSDTDDSSDHHGDQDHQAGGRNLDGHRPSRREIQQTISRNSRRSRSSSTNRNALAATGTNMSLERRPTRRETIISRIRSRPVPVFTHPLSHVQTSAAELVTFDGPDDLYHPLNWPLRKKVLTTTLYGLITGGSAWASSSFSSATSYVVEEFNANQYIVIFGGTSLYLLGFAFGPLLWAPLSEVYGRRAAVLPPVFIAMCFSFATATAKDIQTIFITRFFCAFFASAPVTNTGGVLGDLFTPASRGIAMAGYAMAVVAGPALGPIVSTALAQAAGWRWTQYLDGIIQAVTLLAAVIWVDETYPQKLLIYKARRLRHESGNWALHAKFEEWDVSIAELSRKFLVRPLQLITTPICFLVALYASFCYGILYMQLGAIPIIFREIRGWSPVVGQLPFLCVLIGAVLGCGANVYNQTLYNKAYYAAGNRSVPEKRLPPMMFGAVLFSAGQFLVGWTAEPRYHWIAPCIGLIMTGMGFFTIFQAALNYLVDTFTQYAASAIAANTFLRSIFAAAFPLAVGPMFHNIGTGPGLSITGGFAVLLLPVPFVFYRYGKKIRARSKWSKASVYD